MKRRGRERGERRKKKSRVRERESRMKIFTSFLFFLFPLFPGYLKVRFFLVLRRSLAPSGRRDHREGAQAPDRQGNGGGRAREKGEVAKGERSDQRAAAGRPAVGQRHSVSRARVTACGLSRPVGDVPFPCLTLSRWERRTRERERESGHGALRAPRFLSRVVDEIDFRFRSPMLFPCCFLQGRKKDETELELSFVLCL